ncbi:MAG: hypothetical protein QOJ73_3171 [Streptosporangiaceae bacterium]|jgi:hypothetical protein|nr:hypothetical protein [Streptosporangiaceae bacterium]
MRKSRTNSGVLVVLDRDAKIPLHRQIETSIRDSIRAGRLPRGNMGTSASHERSGMLSLNATSMAPAS